MVPVFEDIDKEDDKDWDPENAHTNISSRSHGSNGEGYRMLPRISSADDMTEDDPGMTRLTGVDHDNYSKLEAASGSVQDAAPLYTHPKSIDENDTYDERYGRRLSASTGMDSRRLSESSGDFQEAQV